MVSTCTSSSFHLAAHLAAHDTGALAAAGYGSQSCARSTLVQGWAPPLALPQLDCASVLPPHLDHCLLCFVFDICFCVSGDCCIWAPSYLYFPPKHQGLIDFQVSFLGSAIRCCFPRLYGPKLWFLPVRTQIPGCCCCSHINSHNQVRRHRTGSSHSGVEEYPRENTHTMYERVALIRLRYDRMGRTTAWGMPLGSGNDHQDHQDHQHHLWMVEHGHLTVIILFGDQVGIVRCSCCARRT